MIGDLLARHRFEGQTRRQVIDFLGDPDLSDPADSGFAGWDIVYILGLEDSGAFSLDDEALGFKFDADGKVIKYAVTTN